MNELFPFNLTFQEVEFIAIALETFKHDNPAQVALFRDLAIKFRSRLEEVDRRTPSSREMREWLYQVEKRVRAEREMGGKAK